MMFSLPDPDVLYDALVARSAAYEGRAYVGVTFNGHFLPPQLPSPQPQTRKLYVF
jgi:AraC family transcriptional regulator of adaptative response/methylated-DNA-[protein]-cysteine methyltransferase